MTWQSLKLSLHCSACVTVVIWSGDHLPFVVSLQLALSHLSHWYLQTPLVVGTVLLAVAYHTALCVHFASLNICGKATTVVDNEAEILLAKMSIPV